MTAQTIAAVARALADAAGPVRDPRAVARVVAALATDGHGAASPRIHPTKSALGPDARPRARVAA